MFVVPNEEAAESKDLQNAAYCGEVTSPSEVEEIRPRATTWSWALFEAPDGKVLRLSEFEGLFD